MRENYKLPDINSSDEMTKANTEHFLADTSFFSTQGQNSNMLTHFGAIENLVVPANWKRNSSDDRPAMHPLHTDFRADGSALLSFREKGYRISDEAGARFAQTLSKPLDAKSLERVIDIKQEDGKRELAGLSPVIADDLVDSRTFRIDQVRVCQLNGHSVLEITGNRGTTNEQGKFISSGTRVSSISIDKFGKGDAIQEIRLEAPAANFAKLKTDIDKSLQKIKWQDRPV